MERRVAACLFALVGLPAAAAQSAVWVVDDVAGPGVDFTSVQAAIDASGQGDVVLLKPGTYEGAFGALVIYAKSIALVADGPGVVLSHYRLDVRDLAPTQEVLLQGLQVSGGLFGFGDVAGLRAVSNEGGVWIESCVFRADSRAQDSRAVSIQRSTFTGTTASDLAWGGLTAQGSNVVAHGSAFRGAKGSGGVAAIPTFPPTPGSPGFLVAGLASLFASGCDFAGGDGGDSLGTIGCYDSGAGGPGLWVGGTAFTLGCSSAGGASGTTTPPCAVGARGAPTFVSGSFADLAGQPTALVASSPVREGQNATLTVQAAPGALALAAAASSQADVLAMWLDPLGVILLGQPWILLPLGTVPASGSVALSVPIGELGPGVEAAIVYLQAATCELASGTCALGAGSAAVLLDASL